MFWGVLTRSAPCVSQGGAVFRLNEVHVALVSPASGYTQRAKDIEVYQAKPLA